MLKIRDSLAMLAAARINANNDDERALAVRAMQAAKLKVVLHISTKPPHAASPAPQAGVSRHNAAISVKGEFSTISGGL
jgi:hypothetical protein